MLCGVHVVNFVNGVVMLIRVAMSAITGVRLFDVTAGVNALLVEPLVGVILDSRSP